MKQNKQFLGRGWSFPPTFDRRTPDDGGTVCMVTADADIHQSLVILFNTVPGERVMLPGYGCPLQSLVFDAIDQHTLKRIDGMLRDAVLRYEPRIMLEDIAFDETRALDGELLITLVYMIRATNTRSNMVYPFYRSEGTNVRRIAT